MLRRVLVVTLVLALAIVGAIAFVGVQFWSRLATAGPPLPVGFAQAAATLPDGRVLLAGERNAQIYDPRTDTWSDTGSLREYHYRYHTLTLLRTGKVLLAGGNGGLALASEIYDPRTGRWGPTGPMVWARSESVAAQLLDGRVLVAGGDTCTRSGSCDTTNAAEIYDPATNSWRGTGSMLRPRQDATATLLRDGEVLVAGGLVCEPCVVSKTAELYDPKTGRWHATASMHVARELHTATLLKDGRVLVAGGDDFSQISTGSIPNTEIYDPATGHWRLAAPMTVGRKMQGALLLPSGNVLMVGGEHAGRALNSVEVYDPAKNAWWRIASLRAKRVSPIVTLLRNGLVLVAGGNGLGITASGYELLRPPPPDG